MQSPIDNKHSIRVASGLPLSTLLSQVWVAFTIEFDNEFERQMEHWTTNHGSTAGTRHGPWLGSLALWSTCMRFVGEGGVTVRELGRLAGIGTNLNGMVRWGYIFIAPDPADSRAKPPRSDWVIHATPAARKAREVWRPLFGTLEERWRNRFGSGEIDQLRESLGALIRRMNVELPDCLPILGYGLFSRGRVHERPVPAPPDDDAFDGLSLFALLSRVLLAFALEFESESDLSLAICANLLRVLDGKGVRVRDLPLLTGVSKEAISMAMGILQKKAVAVIEPVQTGSRARLARLTPKGQEVQSKYRQRLGSVEKRWQAGFGKETVRTLRESLERLVGEPTPEMSPLFRGLRPYPDGWRASVRKPNTLPHYPMVLHRGGYPDGS